jgi:hypothetical protein
MSMRYAHLAPDAFTADHDRIRIAPDTPAEVVRLRGSEGNEE